MCTNQVTEVIRKTRTKERVSYCSERVKMSVISIQLGQCGNQVGFDFYKTLSGDLDIKNIALCKQASRHDYIQDSLERWFHLSEKDKWFARSILIDTEPKVICDVCKKSFSQFWSYQPMSVICHKVGGSGNNWALGYSLGLEMGEEILNSIRREAEKVDNLCAFNAIFSGAGGTGSGVGSRILEYIRDEYPSKRIINSIILPYNTGDTVTQNYNILLTFAKIYDFSDVLILFNNDHLHKISLEMLGNSCVTMTHLNDVLSTKLISFMQPINNYFHRCGWRYLIGDITPHPGYKFVSVRSGPHMIPGSLDYLCYSKATWRVLLKYLSRTLKLNTVHQEGFLDWNIPSPRTSEVKELKSRSRSMSRSCQRGYIYNEDKYVRCIANILITRGSERVNASDLKDFCPLEMYPPWMPESKRFYYLHQSERLLKQKRFAALITNGSSESDIFNRVIVKAWRQYCNQAYLHHYTDNGLTNMDMFESFAKVEAVVDDYKQLQKL